jgi:hypothetical protein
MGFSYTFFTPARPLEQVEDARLSSKGFAGFRTRRPGFNFALGNLGIVMDKLTLRQAFSNYFDFPCQLSFYQLLNGITTRLPGPIE